MEYLVATNGSTNCIYVDDLITSAETIQEASNLSEASHNIMKEASRSLRKHLSNLELLKRT